VLRLIIDFEEVDGGTSVEIKKQILGLQGIWMPGPWKTEKGRKID
jgi:hypothetical protein